MLSIFCKKKGPWFREINIPQGDCFVKQLISAGAKYIAKGNNDKMRYGIWNLDSEEFQSVYTVYPQLSEDEEANWSLTDYSARVRLSPDGKKLVSETYICGILEIFDVTESGLTQSGVRFFFEPRFDYAQGAVPRWVTTTPQSIIGFEDLFLTNEAIYGLVWGVEKNAIENSIPSIVKFDFAGAPICKFMFDDVVGAFAVDKDETIFGIACDPQGTYCLNKYVL